MITDKTNRRPSKDKEKDKPAKADKMDKAENLCLIRAKVGRKRISTIVQQKDLNKFQLSYSNLIRGNMYLSKKRE